MSLVSQQEPTKIGNGQYLTLLQIMWHECYSSGMKVIIIIIIKVPATFRINTCEFFLIKLWYGIVSGEVCCEGSEVKLEQTRSTSTF